MIENNNKNDMHIYEFRPLIVEKVTYRIERACTTKHYEFWENLQDFIKEEICSVFIIETNDELDPICALVLLFLFRQKDGIVFDYFSKCSQEDQFGFLLFFAKWLGYSDLSWDVINSVRLKEKHIEGVESKFKYLRDSIKDLQKLAHKCKLNEAKE